MRQTIPARLAAFALVSALAAPLSAQGINPIFFVDPGQLTAALAPERTPAQTRTMAAQGQLPFVRSQQIPDGYGLPAASLNIEFRDGTALLTANGMVTLRSVAAALNDPTLARSSFQVGGHAVVASSITASQPLSQRRATAVVEHLYAFYGIDPSRLTPVGYGTSKPANGLNLADPANSRIELINVDQIR